MRGPLGRAGVLCRGAHAGLHCGFRERLCLALCARACTAPRTRAERAHFAGWSQFFALLFSVLMASMIDLPDVLVKKAD